MLARLALLFIVIPLLELALLIQLGQWVGFWPTIALVVFTGFLGAAMARAEGLRTLVAFQRETAEGRLPGQAILDGLAVLVGGAFLLTPGLLTDIAGFSLLFPPTRRWLQGAARRWLRRGLESGQVRVQVWTPWADAADGSPFGEGPEEKPGPPELDPRHEIRPDDLEE